jgi:hypothetical protein
LPLETSGSNGVPSAVNLSTEEKVTVRHRGFRNRKLSRDSL